MTHPSQLKYRIAWQGESGRRSRPAEFEIDVDYAFIRVLLLLEKHWKAKRLEEAFIIART